MTQTPVSWPGVSDDVLEARAPDVPYRACGRDRTLGLRRRGRGDAARRRARPQLPDRRATRARSCSRSATRPMQRAPWRCRCSRWSTRSPPTPSCRSPAAPHASTAGRRAPSAIDGVDHAVHDSARPRRWRRPLYRGRGVSDDVLEARAPDVTTELATGIARSAFGVEGEADAARRRARPQLPDRRGGRLVRPQGRQSGRGSGRPWRCRCSRWNMRSRPTPSCRLPAPAAPSTAGRQAR